MHNWDELQVEGDTDYAVVVVMGQNGHNDTYKDCRVLQLLLTTLVALTTENDRLRAIYCLLESCYKTRNAFITSFNETLIFCKYKAYVTENQAESTIRITKLYMNLNIPLQ